MVVVVIVIVVDRVKVAGLALFHLKYVTDELIVVLLIMMVMVGVSWLW